MSEFRTYDAGDQERVRALQGDTEGALGRTMDLPDLAHHPVLIAEVAEKAGQVAGAHYLESVPEYCVVGRSAEVTLAAIKRAPEVLAVLKENGFRVVRVFVPKWMGKDTETIVAALHEAGAREESEYRQMIFDLR